MLTHRIIFINGLDAPHKFDIVKEVKKQASKKYETRWIDEYHITDLIRAVHPDNDARAPIDLRKSVRELIRVELSKLFSENKVDLIIIACTFEKSMSEHMEAMEKHTKTAMEVRHTNPICGIFTVDDPQYDTVDKYINGSERDFKSGYKNGSTVCWRRFRSIDKEARQAAERILRKLELEEVP